MNGAAMISAERRRQILEEGWTAAHDDAYEGTELLDAAIQYVDHAAGGDLAADGSLPTWPWAHEWWKPSDDPYSDLVKGGALIAAEIDRRRRAAGDDPYVVPRPSRESAAPELTELGEDGQFLVGYGHLEQRVFLGLAVAHLARIEGIEAAEELIKCHPDIRHAWALEARCTEENFDDRPGGVILGDDYAWWGGVEADTPGAFPITILDREG